MVSMVIQRQSYCINSMFKTKLQEPYNTDSEPFKSKQRESLLTPPAKHRITTIVSFYLHHNDLSDD